MKTILVVRVVDNKGTTIDAYYRNVKLPFIPTVGMKLKISSSKPLWATMDGRELDPPMKEIVYNLDENEMLCLFEVNSQLISEFWWRIHNISNSHELKQFTVNTDFEMLQESCVVDEEKNKSENAVADKRISLNMLFFSTFIPVCIMKAFDYVECII